MASAISIAVSYAGHHRYTFERRGHHGFYLPRFIAVTVALFLLSTLGMYVFTVAIPTDPIFVAIVITATYPVASYVSTLCGYSKCGERRYPPITTRFPVPGSR